MPEASARIRNDGKIARSARPGWKAAWRRVIARGDRRTIAGAALAAMMIGIVVNAVALQHGRRVDLGLAPDRTAVAAIKPVAPVAVAKAASAAPASSAAVPEPPQRPQTTSVALAHPQKSADAITDFLRGQNGDKRKLTLAAQGALAKLGFSVKATGSLDAETRSALIEFEKSQRLPTSTEVTAKLVHALKEAASAE